MKQTSRLLLVAAASAALAACSDSPTFPEPPCAEVPFQQAEVRGDTVVTTTGLRYIEGLPGSGTQVARCRAVGVFYTLFLADGTQLETNVNGSRLEFIPGVAAPTRLIAGFEQGVIGMRAGGTRRLIIPPALGYGPSPTHPLRNETLIFDITVDAVQAP